MGISTVSGPFRSENGFQQLDENGVWVPVAGGGGGGGTTFVKFEDTNRFSNNKYNPTPSGPTAGNVITLPSISVGETITFYANGGSNSDTWKVQLSIPSDADIVAFLGSFSQINDNGVYSAPSFIQPIQGAGPGVPSDSVFFYGFPITPFQFIRMPNLVVPGFGTVAVYNTLGIAVLPQAPTELGNVNIYPFTNLLAP